MKQHLAYWSAMIGVSAPLWAWGQPTSAPATAPAAPANAPAIEADSEIFVDSLDVRIRAPHEAGEVRYTLDGSEPTSASPRVEGPVRIEESGTVKARAFSGEVPSGPIGEASFSKVTPQPPAKVDGLIPGLLYDYYEGEWEAMPMFGKLPPVHSSTMPNFDLSVRDRDDQFALRFRGYLTVPTTGVYRFSIRADQGARLYLDRSLVVDGAAPPGPGEVKGEAALAAGAHSLAVIYFEQTGDQALEISYAGPGIEKQRIPDSSLSHQPN